MAVGGRGFVEVYAMGGDAGQRQATTVEDTKWVLTTKNKKKKILCSTKKNEMEKLEFERIRGFLTGPDDWDSIRPDIAYLPCLPGT